MSEPYRTASAQQAEHLPRDGFTGGVTFVIFVVGFCLGAFIAWSWAFTSTTPQPHREQPCTPRVEALNDGTTTRCVGAGATIEIDHQGRADYAVCRCPLTDGGVR